MKLSNDQKRMLKGIALYVPGYFIGFTLFRWLFGKDVSWSDVLIFALSGVVLAAVFAVFTIFGARVPTRDDAPAAKPDSREQKDPENAPGKAENEVPGAK